MGFPRWAPLTWYMFHKLSYEYKESENDSYKSHYISFFQRMKTIIPCKTCRGHFIENTGVEENKIESNITKENVFPWTVRLHNLVNKMHHKKIYSVEEAKKLYEIPFQNSKMYSFINDYLMYNLNKGIEKDNELINMLKDLCYIYPNPVKREKLIAFVEKLPPQKEKIRQWLTVFYQIIQRKEP